MTIASLNIPATGRFFSLGALVTRLSPGNLPLTYAKNLQLHVSGGEYNVAANLAACFEVKTAVVSAMSRGYPTAKLIEREVRAMGVTPYYKYYDYDGVTKPTMATIFSDCGSDVRGPVVGYNRANEAAALLKPGDFDWAQIFSNEGIRWFHSGGIFAALSKTTPQLIVEGMQSAKKAGAVVSFDLNYRAKLWKVLGGQEKAVETLADIVKNVDVLVGNEEDLQMGLGLPGPKIEKQSGLDSEAFISMIGATVKKFPNLKVIATTLRQVHNANWHDWSAVAWINGEIYQAPIKELRNIVDRIGGGDGFASGLFYGLLEGRSPQEAVNLGWAHGALLTTTPGDTTMVTLEDVENLAKGGSSRVVR